MLPNSRHILHPLKLPFTILYPHNELLRYKWYESETANRVYCLSQYINAATTNAIYYGMEEVLIVTPALEKKAGEMAVFVLSVRTYRAVRMLYGQIWWC